MEQSAALKLSIDLLHSPLKVRSLRSVQLPDDVLGLVRIAAGDGQTIKDAAVSTGRSPKLLQEAAGFYVEQVMLHPGADAYRVLGARHDATYAQLRRNMTILLRWLHPDGDRHGERAVFASRVTEAWDHLKTDERRAAYDRSRRKALRESTSSGGRQGHRSGRSMLKGQPVRPAGKTSSRPLRYRPSDRMRAAPKPSLFRRILSLLLGRSAL
jgi:hypothetical protein